MAEAVPAQSDDDRPSRALPVQYVWRGERLGIIVEKVPYGCAMNQMSIVGKLEAP